MNDRWPARLSPIAVALIWRRKVLTMVNIALGNAQLLDCEAADANHDGQITVDEILTAVNNALNGWGDAGLRCHRCRMSGVGADGF